MTACAECDIVIKNSGKKSGCEPSKNVLRFIVRNCLDIDDLINIGNGRYDEILKDFKKLDSEEQKIIKDLANPLLKAKSASFQSSRK